MDYFLSGFAIIGLSAFWYWIGYLDGINKKGETQ